MPAQPPGGSPVPPSADPEPGPEPGSQAESRPEPEPEPEAGPRAEVEPEATSQPEPEPPGAPEPPASSLPPAPDLSRYPPPRQPPLSQNPPPGTAPPAQQYPPPTPDLSQYPPPQPPVQQYPPPRYPAYGGPPPPGYRPAPPPGATTTNQRLLGLVLVVPALLLWIFTLLDPSIKTLWRSFHGQRFGRGPIRGGGASNYSDAIHQGYWGSIGAGLFWSLGPLVAVGVVAPALAFLAWRAGTGLRRTVLVAFALPIATFTPAGWALAQLGTRHHTVFDPKHHNSTTRLFFWTATFAFACSLATMLYLAALRRWAPGPWGPGRMGPLVAVWVVLVLAAVAFTEQSFAVSFTLGVSQKHAPPELFQFQRAFRFLILGPSQAASAMTLLGLAVFGLAAGLVVVFSRLRIQIEPPTPNPATATSAGASGEPPSLVKAEAPPPPGGPVSRPWRPDPAVVIVGAVLLAAVLVVTGWALWPWFSKAFHGSTALNHGGSTATRLKNTLLPPLIAVLIQVPAAFLAALGIGALRPLGRWSELLLVPFLPWLFVTAGPLNITFFSDAGNGHDLNKFSTLIPRILLSVPALVLLTALCRGLAVRWRATRIAGAPAGATFWRTVLVPALPMVLLLAGVEYLVTVQDVHWPLLASSTPDHFNGTLLLFSIAQEVAAPSGAPIAWALPPVLMVLSAIGLIALMVAYVDRLSIRTGPVETE